MGALSFQNSYIGKDSPSKAFDKLVAEALYEYGHRGYTGTIAEKDSFVMKDLPKRVDPNKFIDKIIDDNDKWGPAFCVEIKGQSLKKLKEKYKLKGKRGIRSYIFFGYASY